MIYEIPYTRRGRDGVIGAVLLSGSSESGPDLKSPSVTRAYTSVYFGIGILLHRQDKQIRFCNYVLLSQVSPAWAHLFFAVRTPT